MPLSASQKNYIIKLDGIGKSIMQEGGEEALLMSLIHKMDDIKNIMDAASHEELDHYCAQYDGFYYYMKMLEMMAKGCADGIFDDIIKK